ncbi:phage tail sheath family protein [Enterobacter roggenkampii]|uniref:phage tail sheath family protein n=1 Tax=Enterobacter roggenkampii TaxID=1812935 RepID=UPI002DBFF9B5|nr:phage tail sheath C-terminal domain-containing protein [Enterobacter roggenkampii]MEB5889995.1 phage tail sheath family protein [Enterobacter roggenkampii]
MTSTLPGIQLSTETRASKAMTVDTAVPLFIGYTTGQHAAGEIRFIENVDTLSSGVLHQTLQHYFASGGQGCYVFSLGGWDEQHSDPASDLASRSVALGQALGAETTITLLAFPDMIRIPDGDPVTWGAVWQSMAALCDVRPGLFAVLDTPFEAEDTVTALKGFAREGQTRTAAYWPHLYTDGEQGTRITVPPSGAVIASVQHVDHQYGVWRAPANIALPQVICPVCRAVEYEHLFALQDVACNLIRSFPGRGTRIWGCRTLTSDHGSSFRYIQMRRLLDYVERSLGLLARMYLFEPNNEVTWYKIKGQFHNWLRRLWQQGGLSGGQESDAFSIRLGLNETMTQDDILTGKMIVLVRIAPLNPAEYIDITLQLNAQAAVPAQITTQEMSHARK